VLQAENRSQSAGYTITERACSFFKRIRLRRQPFRSGRSQRGATWKPVHWRSSTRSTCNYFEHHPSSAGVEILQCQTQGIPCPLAWRPRPCLFPVQDRKAIRLICCQYDSQGKIYGDPGIEKIKHPTVDSTPVLFPVVQSMHRALLLCLFP